MLRTAAFLLLAFGFAALQPGARDGRAGNRLLAAGDVRGAAAAFRAGTERAGVPDDLAARLWHNLGLALARDTTDAPDAPPVDSLAIPADSAFAQALRLAADPADRARIAYDAGTAALIAGDAAAAVALLRRSLVLDPARLAARRNYEIARRALARQTPPTPPEPSDEARRIKARADALVAERRYRDALDTMTEGLARDSTVAAFADFTDRLGKVVEIEEDPARARGSGPETTGPPAPVAPAPTSRPPNPAPAGPTRL
ncbi:MAG TPA: hypothetical protein VGB53_06090 [Rubricoccaceae bacterium]|jgi:tetratricopeptide (TPR) repeat protein